MRRILLSALLVVAGIGGLIYGTTAFFSDTETSEENTFQAGSIDLKVGNDSYLVRDGVIATVSASTWQLDDLTDQVFFDMEDIKPGDLSEDTIALKVDDNDAYLCIDFQLTGAGENTAVDPELADGDTVDNGTWDGELDDNLNFLFWADDGDNVLEDNEIDGFIMEAQASDLLQFDNNPGIRFPLADSIINVWKAAVADEDNPDFSGPVTAGTTYFIGKAWCYGEINPSLTPVVQDNLNTQGPIERNTTGVECNGSDVTNISQTDTLVGNISFYAEQSRNNPDFVCNPDIEL